MLIRDRLAEGPTLSFEFFPPRDGLGFWDLRGAIDSLHPLSPDFVSVTCPANRSTPTAELAVRIKRDLRIESMAHLTCSGASRAEIAHVVDGLCANDIGNILVLRGDPPEGEPQFTPADGGFRYASELAAFIRERHPSLCLGGACYPEGHPEAPNREKDLENLKKKVDAGVDFLITQLFFDNADFLAFRERAHRAGIHVPILAGIMPVLSVRQIKRFTQMCGATIPKDLLKRIEAVEDDAEAVRQIGMYHATEQCRGLLREGAAGMHFYTLNGSTATRAIFQYIRSDAARSMS